MKRITGIGLLWITLSLPAMVSGHPLGNFSLNRYARLEPGPAALRIYYVLDIAEIPTFQQMPHLDHDGDGVVSADERNRYRSEVAAALMRSLDLQIGGTPAKLHLVTSTLELVPGQGGLPTLYMTFTLETPMPWLDSEMPVSFRDEMYGDRMGWKEIVVRNRPGVAVVQSSVSRRDVSDALRNYPIDNLSSPLDVRQANLLVAKADVVAPAAGSEATNLIPPNKTGDAFTRLIDGEEPGLAFILFAVLAALFWGAVHALSPGHGKTIVTAYLIGSRGTAKHAAILGATVTLTHTIGVFALGLVTLFASQYVLPEKLYPWLSLISGAIVIGIGLYMLVRRMRHLGETSHHHPHQLSHIHEHAPGHDDSRPSHTHTHTERSHSHLPPGAAGEKVTLKSLLALGVSGGILPCPSALVVLLSAIAVHRVGFGLLLIVAFSLGLAGVLTGIGLVLVYAKQYFERFRTDSLWMRGLPALSALIILVAGVAISEQAFAQIAITQPDISAKLSGLFPTSTVSAVSILGLGFVLGLKHALDADHLIAISTIVSEKRDLWRSSLVGALWGLGHTASLLGVGLVVIFLHKQIPERLALAMEFLVGIMLVLLGVNVLRKLFSSQELHLHVHEHAGHRHTHPHLHSQNEPVETHTHHGFKVSRRPFWVGIVHGMAGSAALMLLVLSTIESPFIGVIYIGVFGVGTIGGMFVMSTAISLPFTFTARRFLGFNRVVRIAAGVLSIGFGFFLMYQIGFIDGLFLF